MCNESAKSIKLTPPKKMEELPLDPPLMVIQRLHSEKALSHLWHVFTPEV
jgi:hypothetical protein